jgi:hypothetical protein
LILEALLSIKSWILFIRDKEIHQIKHLNGENFSYFPFKRLIKDLGENLSIWSCNLLTCCVHFSWGNEGNCQTQTYENDNILPHAWS